MIALILSGGVGLGAYHAGVYEALTTHGVKPDWIAGSSIGAVTAALLAGSAPGEEINTLQSFWRADFGTPRRKISLSGHWLNWMSAVEARVVGVPGHFRPRLGLSGGRFVSLYDLAPMRDRLLSLVNFDRLNSGACRISVATTDIETGDLVIFDTAKGDRISVDHLLASCGFLPEFAPVEIGGRLLGDGGLSANAPVEAVLGEAAPAAEMLCFIADLYSRDGGRPASLEAAFARRSDLLFGNQTWQRLESYRREVALRAGPRTDHRFFYLSYRAPSEEAGPEKIFDYSPRSIGHRWRTGADDARLAVLRAEQTQGAFVIEAIRHRHETVAPEGRGDPRRAAKAPPAFFR
jgi:NTE family protein